MGVLKYKRTEDIVQRLKKLQSNKGYSDTEIAEQIGIKPTTYKNIIRSTDSGGNKSIKDSYVKKLADFYNCTTAYILCESDEENLNRHGHPVIKPYDFSKKDTLILELNNYLKSDLETLQALHFLLCQNPSWRRAEYLRGFHAVVKALMEHSLMERFKKSSGDDFKVFVEETMKYDENYFHHILKLHHANQSLDIADFPNALKNYIEIIYDTLTQSLIYVPIAHKAAEQVLWLTKNWNSFPTELKIIVDTLPQIQQNNFLIKDLSNKDLLEANNDDKVYKDIKLSEQIINKLAQYLFFSKENC